MAPLRSTLNKERLDVVNKTQSNPFTWKGQFTPDLISYLLDEYSQPDSIIADTFSGSGTVLHESIKKGNACIGFEINPSAYFMSRFYSYAALSNEQREYFMNEIRHLIGAYVMSIPDSVPVYIQNCDYRSAYANLIEFCKFISTNTPEHLWPFLINVVFLCEKDKKKGLKESLICNINRIKSFFFSLPHTSKEVQVYNQDARRISTHVQNEIDLIITSPPYVNVFNYHQNYRGLIECFGFNIFDVASSEFGSNRKNRVNRFKTVIQYSLDMGQTLFRSAEAMKIGGKMIYIVGKESNVCKTPIYNSNIIFDLVESICCLEVKEVNCRHFTNRYGECIQEDLLTIEKVNLNCEMNPDTFRSIGIRHLEQAISYACNESKELIKALLNGKEIYSITPSSLYA